MLSPLLYIIYTHDCTPSHSRNTIVKFAEDTTMVGLISDVNESAYRVKVEQLTGCCKDNLILNATKTKEPIVAESIEPLYIGGNKTAKTINSTTSRQGHELFELLSSGKRYRTIKCRSVLEQFLSKSNSVFEFSLKCLCNSMYDVYRMGDEHLI